MKVLITGGAGFIGSHIIEEVVRQGWDAIVVDNLSNGHRQYVPPEIPFYEMDIRSQDMEKVFVVHQPDIIIHQAAQGSVDYSKKFPAMDCEINIQGTLNLLQLSVKYSVTKFIFSSSAAIYGDNTMLPINEGQVGKPISFYGLSKLSAENYIRLYGSLHNLKYSILRYSNVYGMRQNTSYESGVVNIFSNQYLQKQPLRVYGNGLQTRDFVFVRDVAKANIQAVKYGDNETFNISSNHPVSINELIKEIKQITGEELTVSYELAKAGDIKESHLNNSRAKALLNWIPTTELREGLKETIHYYRNLA